MHQLWTHRSSLDNTHLELKFSSRMWLWPNTRGGPASFVNININMIFLKKKFNVYNHNFILTVISFPLILNKKNNLLIIKQLHIQQCGFYTIWLCWCSMCVFNRITRKAGAKCLLQMLDSILLGRKAAKLVTVTFDSSLCRCILWWRCFLSN